MAKPKNIPIGTTFGRWRVVSFAGQSAYHNRLWQCACSCGKVGIVLGKSLRNGNSQSCGCLRIERTIESRTKHGTLHYGEPNPPEYTAWSNMISRCENSKHHQYKDYGGRGISIWEPWRHSFGNFFAYIGKRPSSKHTLDRINNNLGYMPGNIRWATWKEQQRNRRSNKRLMHMGVVKTQIEWAEHLGMSPEKLKDQIENGDLAGYSVVS